MTRRIVAWLLASVMPFHAMTAVYLDVLGPAHFHVVHHDDHSHDHDHGNAARHHHHHDEPGVVTVHEETASGWSSTVLAAGA